MEKPKNKLKPFSENQYKGRDESLRILMMEGEKSDAIVAIVKFLQGDAGMFRYDAIVKELFQRHPTLTIPPDSSLSREVANYIRAQAEEKYKQATQKKRAKDLGIYLN